MPKFTDNYVRIRGTNLKLREWFVCKTCKGNGTKACNADCMLWKDRRSMTNIRIGKFLYKFIADDKSTNTTRHHIESPVKFVMWLHDNGHPEVTNVQDLKCLYNGNRNDLEELIERFIRYLRDDYVYKGKTGLKPKGLHNIISDLCGIFEINDISLRPKKIRRTVGIEEDEESSKSYAYSRDQIKIWLNELKSKTYCALVLLLATTGMRSSGVWDTSVKRDGTHGCLKIKDLRPATDGYDNITWDNEGSETVYEVLQRNYPNIIANPTFEITVYRGYKEEYETFCSPEAYEAIRAMLQERKDAGEDVEGHDIDVTDHKAWKDRVEYLKKMDLDTWMKKNRELPVFRTRIGATQTNRGQTEYKRRRSILDVRPLDDSSFTKHLDEVRDAVGDKLKYTNDGHRIDLTHGFRHFHKITLDDTDGIKPNYSTWLEGRKLDKVEAGYLRGGKLSYKVLIEYFKAVNRLTVFREEIVIRENKMLTSTIHDIQSDRTTQNAAIAGLNDKLDALAKRVERRDTEVEWLTALAIRLGAKPEEIEQGKRMLKDGSLPLEYRKVLEIPKLESSDEGEGDSE